MNVLKTPNVHRRKDVKHGAEEQPQDVLPLGVMSTIVIMIFSAMQTSALVRRLSIARKLRLATRTICAQRAHTIIVGMAEEDVAESLALAV